MKYKVEITVMAKKTFTYDIEAESQRRAMDRAFDKAVDDFSTDNVRVEEDDIQIEQQTKKCEECGTEYEILTAARAEAPNAWTEDDDYCAKCGVKILEEEKAEARC